MSSLDLQVVFKTSMNLSLLSRARLSLMLSFLFAILVINIIDSCNLLYTIVTELVLELTCKMLHMSTVFFKEFLLSVGSKFWCTG